ncbi:MAG: prepilin-type N-terminal cleavage/methylation domain-containing protein [Candidatus Gastranaerophilaceae bacterium]
MTQEALRFPPRKSCLGKRVKGFTLAEVLITSVLLGLSQQ